MNWVSIDPSTTSTGVAVWQGGTLVEAFRLAPRLDDALDRVDAIVDDLEVALSGNLLLDEAVIEVPSPGRGRGSQAGATGRLAIYGMAVGAVRQALRPLMHFDRSTGRERIVAVTELEWTRGVAKQARQRMVAAEYPGMYDASGDPGMDVSDAIGLGMWRITMRRLEHAGALPRRRTKR